MLRRYPHGQLRMTRSRCDSLHLHRDGLAPSTPCRSPGALRLSQDLYSYGDGNGLLLLISKWQTKPWLLRYQLAGRDRFMGLGSLNDVSLADARAKARTARNHLIDAIDPIELRRAKKLALRAKASKQITFKAAAEKYVAAHRAGWKSQKTVGQFENTLETYAMPIIGALAVAGIETGHITRIIEPLWADKTVTANRVRQRIEAVLDWAKAHGYREGDNPAKWKGHLDKLLPAKKKGFIVKSCGGLSANSDQLSLFLLLSVLMVRFLTLPASA